MKKILMLLLVCTLVFSITFTMTSCDLINSLFGNDTPNGDEPGGDQPGGDQPGGDQPGGDTPGEGDNTGNGSIFDGVTNNGTGGIELPIVDVNSTDMTIPPEGSETEGSEETNE